VLAGLVRWGLAFGPCTTLGCWRILPIPWATIGRPFCCPVSAILVRSLRLGVVSRQKMGWFRALAGSVLMGGVLQACLHRHGRHAFTCMVPVNSFLVVLSVAFAVLISLAALWITFHFRDEKTGSAGKS